jgi:hypothetical protein
MRNASLAPVSEQVGELESLYGKFDIGLEGRPTPVWENRNLKSLRLPEMLAHAFFPDVYLARVLVNRRVMGSLERVYIDICSTWNKEARSAYGLNKFVKCYCFGDGAGPNLFWYGAAWELSAEVHGEALSDVVKLFTRHGFTHGYTSDKKKLRTFEYW